MRPSTNYLEWHLCHRHLLFDIRRVRAAPGRKWAQNLAWLLGNTGLKPSLRRGSAAITRGGLMLLMRERERESCLAGLHAREVWPLGVSLTRADRPAHRAALTRACTHSHTHTHARFHKNTHKLIKYQYSHTKPPSFTHNRSQTRIPSNR